MTTIYSATRKEFVSFSKNGGDCGSIIATHKINADDKYYGAQFLQSKHFSTEAGAIRWAKKQLAA